MLNSFRLRIEWRRDGRAERTGRTRIAPERPWRQGVGWARRAMARRMHRHIADGAPRWDGRGRSTLKAVVRERCALARYRSRRPRTNRYARFPARTLLSRAPISR